MVWRWSWRNDGSEFYKLWTSLTCDLPNCLVPVSPLETERKSSDSLKPDAVYCIYCILFITCHCIISHSWCSSGRVWAPTGRLYGPHSAGDGAMRVRARLLWRSGPGQSWTPCDQWPVSSPRSLTSVAAPASDCTSVHSVHVYTGQALPSCRPQLTKSKWHRPQQIKNDALRSSLEYTGLHIFVTSLRDVKTLTRHHQWVTLSSRLWWLLLIRLCSSWGLLCLIVSHYFPDLFIVTGVSALETFSLSGSVRQKHIDFSGNVPTVITSAAKYCPPPDFY